MNIYIYIYIYIDIYIYIPIYIYISPKKCARNRRNVKYVECVKCFGGNLVKNNQTFNIFNISPVLSIFGKKTFNISPVS